MSLVQPLLLGLTLGVRHAFEPDHLAAITALASRTLSSKQAATTGAAWGLGHAAAIVMLGSLVVACRVRVPSGIVLVLDLAVAGVLVVLAIQALWIGKGAQPPPSSGAHVHGRRSTVVGFVHGASGTAAITLICLTTFSSWAKAVGFLVLFALGALISMSMLSGLLAGPLAAIARKGERASRMMRVGGGLVALVAAVVVVISALGSSGAS